MQVVFSDHARKRCQQRGIPLDYVRRQLEGLPKMVHITHWDFQDGMRVAFAAYPERLVVLSVMRRGR